MRGMLFNFQGKGVSEVSEISVSLSGSGKWSKEGREPTSVLDTRRSHSPPTSTSTLSSSLGGGDTAGVAAVSEKWPQEDGRKEEWDSELHPIPATLDLPGERFRSGMEDWDTILAGSESSPSQEQSFLRFFLGDVEDLKQVGCAGSAESESGNAGFGIVDPSFGFFESGNALNSSSTLSATGFSNNARILSNPNPSSLLNCFNNCNPLNPIFSNNLPLPLSLPPGVFYQQQLEPVIEKSQLLSPQNLLSPQQQVYHLQNNPPFFVPLSYTHHEQQQQQQHHLLPGHPPPKTHDPNSAIIDPSDQIPKMPFADTGNHDLFLHRQPQQLGISHLQQQATKPKLADPGGDQVAHHEDIIGQLFNAAELIETGNSVHAQGILARLNHQLSPTGKPLQRASFYFKEALQLVLHTNHNNTTLLSSPLDIVLKIAAYKVFSDVSPILQFTNFTCNQALLESLDGFNRIHVIDFNIGLGGQWASFMQELAMKPSGAPCLKITAFAFPSFDHPLELELARESLSHFANHLNIPFEFNVVNLDSFDPTVLNVSDNEAIAVNFPVGSSHPSAPSFLRLIKQLSPKIVVSIDRGCDRSDLSFSQHFLNALQSYSVLLDSLEAINLNAEALLKIERYLIKPAIASIVLGRQRATEKMMPWRNLFMSAGFTPLPFSNMTENQADCLVKRFHVRGFHVEKRQNSFLLCWQQGELVSASAWRC